MEVDSEWLVTNKQKISWRDNHEKVVIDPTGVGLSPTPDRKAKTVTVVFYIFPFTLFLFTCFEHYASLVVHVHEALPSHFWYSKVTQSVLMSFSAITEAKIGGVFFKQSILPQHLDIRYANVMVGCFLNSICIVSPAFPMGISTRFGNFFPWCTRDEILVLYVSVLLKEHWNSSGNTKSFFRILS